MRNCPLLIKNLDVDPMNNHRWVPDGVNQWFLPVILDFTNNTYGGYWYASESCEEPKHTHRGIAQGYILQGEIILTQEGENYLIRTNENFLVSPHQSHSAKLIPHEDKFLMFSLVIGITEYENEIIDIQSYSDLVKSHYDKHNISLDTIKNMEL